ncbi:MAG: UDP-N-acetylmuramoyl-L-alanyl-D-glutamate--2,6-diaminopimelate ligase [Eubacteriales bacterium]
MQLSELLAVPGLAGCATRPIPQLSVDRVCDDSRRVSSGCLFVAVEGAVSDGHDYLQSAYRLGCRAFVVEKRQDELPEDAFVFLAEDSRKALALLSARILGDPGKKLTLIGITGTKGKTTTALMLRGILCRAGIAAGYIGSNGVRYADVSLPDTKNTTPGSAELNGYLAAMVDAGITHVVLEVSSQALYMRRVYGLTFSVVIFTNLGVDHIGGAEHPTFEHYKASKRSLFFDYGAQTMVVNIDDPNSADMTPPGIRILTVSEQRDADYSASGIRFLRRGGLLGVAADCSVHGVQHELELVLPGKFNIINALCAAAAAEALGVESEVSFSVLRETLVEGRFECVPVVSDRFFVIDFAHNGMALRSVLEALRQYKPKRLVCVFGSVGGRTRGRRKQLGDVAAQLCDEVILTADDPDYEPVSDICADILPSFDGSLCRVRVIEDREEAIRTALAESLPGDIVLFAGKGHESFQLVRGVRQYFSERELIRKYRSLIPSVGSDTPFSCFDGTIR